MYEKVAGTKNMSHEEWLRYRKQGIGGSDAGAICGVNPFSSPISVYHDKTSDEVEETDSETMRQGRDLEEYVARRFMEETGKKVRKSNYLYRSTEYPFMQANVDRLVVGEAAGLECKTASAWKEDKWKDGAVPDHYFIQCQHYMAVTGMEAWYIAVVILGRDFKWKRIGRDDDLIASLRIIEADFWNNHVVPRVLPDPDGSAIYDDILEKYFHNVRKEHTVQLIGHDEALRRRGELDGLIKKLSEEKNEIDQKLKLCMGESEYALSDRYRVSWSGVTKSGIDAKRLKEEKPEIYEEYRKTTEYRRFTVREAA